MEEKPTVRLQPEVVQDTPAAAPPEPAPVAEVPAPVVEPKSDTWSKFPPQVDRGPTNKPSKKLLWIVILLIAIAVAVVGLVVRQLLAKDDSVRTVVSDESTPTPTEEPTAAPTPTPEITEKSEVKIQVLNASGITGRAGVVATGLEGLDFEDVATGNAQSSDQVETVVEYSPKVSMEFVTEVLTYLREDYTNVREIANTALEDYHILISMGTDEEAE